MLHFSGPAALDGSLRVGDQLIEMNSQSTKNMTHGEAIELIKYGGLTVRLLVSRGKASNSAFLGKYKSLKANFKRIYYALLLYIFYFRPSRALSHHLDP